MKLLIRTITLATIGMFLFLVILNTTTVEVVKQEMETSTEAAINRVVNAWVKNQRLLYENDDNLYFKTDEDFYYFFYDSLVVQLNGKLNVTVYCNDINVDTGDLDIDAVATYYGLDRKERTYTVHATTEGKLPDESYYGYNENIINGLKTLTAGKKAIWAEHNWVVVENDGEDLILLLDDDFSYSKFGNIQYKYSTLKTANDNFYESLDEQHRSQLNEYSADNMNTYAGVYVEGGSDIDILKVFALSASQAENLYLNGYETPTAYWTRTVNDSQSIKIMTGTGLATEDKEASMAVKPAVCLNKNKITWLNYNVEKDAYELDK